MSVVVVTDSTASLPKAVVAEHGIVVVALQVAIGTDVHDEGSEGATPDLVAAALREHRPVSTSRASPTTMREVYRRAVERGATEIVSVHLSRDISGTYESAQLAARDAAVPVVAVDSRQVGVATGYAALAACAVVEGGGTGVEAAEAARVRAAASTSLFYVDTLDYLRRGGRIGAAAALLGGALAVKPLLQITDGMVTSLERVRTSTRALARLADLAVEAADDAGADATGGAEGGAGGRRGVDVCVAHLASPERAAELTSQLAERLGERLAGRGAWCLELGAVLGAHVGPGTLAVCVAPALPG